MNSKQSNQRPPITNATAQKLLRRTVQAELRAGFYRKWGAFWFIAWLGSNLTWLIYFWRQAP